MRRIVSCVLFIYVLKNASGIKYANSTLDPASRQLLDFKLMHPEPIGVHTTTAGKPLDIRETITLNTNVFNNPYFWDLQTGIDSERIPERATHAKGTGAFGYFVVTNDVSKYTKADVFNGIGKKTKVLARFSRQVQNTGGADLVREEGGIAVKFYTNEGNLDLLCLSFPVFLYRQPHNLGLVVHSSKRNPKTNLNDPTNALDFLTTTVDGIHQFLWTVSDYGITNGYRKMDAFALQTYEVNNKHGDSYFVRFNFRTELGLELLTDEAARILRSRDPDLGARDLYNAIATGNFPSWRLEMDIIPKENILKLDYNPFDVTRLWKNGTYHTVTIGRMIINRNLDNWFSELEQAGFNPGNLVPGIPGPPDDMFKARRFAYRDAQAYRLGINHNNIPVNRPKNKPKVYNRDGVPDARDNMKDAPNYYQNSFNGPVPFVDVARPREAVEFYDRNAIDLEPPAEFYNTYVVTEGQRNRMAANIASIMVNAVELVQNNTLKLLTWIDKDLGRRSALALQAAKAAQKPKLILVQEHPRTLDILSDPLAHYN